MNVKNKPGEDWIKLKTKKPTVNTDYYVSNLGRIKSVDKASLSERLINGSTTSGNLAITIRNQGGGKETIYINRAIAEYYVRRPSSEHKFVICKDNNKNNCHYQNLQWVTQEELTKFQIGAGHLRGPKKLTLTQVQLIKKRLGKGVKVAILARQFNVTTRTIERIRDGEMWSSINPLD